MEPESITSQNLEPQKTRKFSSSFFLLIVLTLVIIVAVLGYIFRTPTTPTITGLEVALKTALFLDKTLQPDGSMLGGYECEQSAPNKCSPIPLSADMPHTGQAIFGYFLLAEASGDPSYRAKADKSINFVLDRCETDVLMCEWNFFPLAKYYEITKEDKYLTRGMLPPAEKLLAIPDYDAIIGNVGHKLASLYTATKDERYKKRLVEIADAELPKPIENPNLAFQVIWSIYLPAYKITGDSKYFLASKEFFDNYNIERRTSSEEFKDVASIVYLIKAADGLLSLAELSENKETYRVKAHAILQTVLNKLWDTPESLKFNGDYGFIEDTITPDKAPKSTLFNGWLIKLFVLMKDDKFNKPMIN